MLVPSPLCLRLHGPAALLAALERGRPVCSQRRGGLSSQRQAGGSLCPGDRPPQPRCHRRPCAARASAAAMHGCGRTLALSCIWRTCQLQRGARGDAGAVTAAGTAAASRDAVAPPHSRAWVGAGGKPDAQRSGTARRQRTQDGLGSRVEAFRRRWLHSARLGCASERAARGCAAAQREPPAAPAPRQRVPRSARLLGPEPDAHWDSVEACMQTQLLCQEACEIL
mmetsp:Transcript_35615/g.105262  ORF Transcript_35615/g.105262 Transcript_35615/m.105262 type:complete len:225 (+) Transcript_35615:442-1116(+)